MAILWKKTIDNTQYEVRSAGASRRLYTNGVFHSQWNPKRPVTGNIWDLLALPVLFVDTATIKRVLVLGVGGGAVIQLLQQLVPSCRVTGVELNPVHISIAKKYFDVRSKYVDLIHADAIHWLESYKGEPFDVIIEDLFGETRGEPVRAIELAKDWFSVLHRHLNQNGLLVINTIGAKQLQNCAFFKNDRINQYFKSAYRLSLPTYENAIAAFFKQHVSRRELNLNTSHEGDIKIRKALLSLSYQLRKLK